MSHSELPKQADPYIEARIDLIEQFFSQLMGFFPPEASEAMAAEYNRRRTAVILKHLPDSDLAKALQEAEAKQKQAVKLSVVQPSIILPN